MDFQYTILIPILLFFSFVYNILWGRTRSPKIAGLISTTTILIAAVLSYYTAYQYFFNVGLVNGSYEKIIAFKMVWLHFSDTLVVDMGILLDPISIMMLVVVTTISSMVHIYSFGYMHGDDGFARFYAFLSLFSFSMLGLVVSSNIFQMYIFWELVGVSSFLLIGYYYQKPSAVAAAKKAFIVTRFADLGFLVGILLISYVTGSLDFAVLTDPNGPVMLQGASLGFMGLSVMTWALILIFIGGAGKSAMFPFHIWLPDAMEGPTPVSALIHAATMVVAGVYLVARLFPLFHIAAPDAQYVVLAVGGFTSLFAAVIAITQIDIKRVLAFSTLSQLGYMMAALGASGYGAEEGIGYTASMWHLFTHAMFKALLFLGAGSIIHAVHSNNMTEMGGLRKYMPITHITFLIGTLAIAGIPPFAGFFSKDEILVALHQSSHFWYWVEVITAGLTAFYMFRLYFNVFWGENRHYHHKPHESSLSMTFPLMFLAFMAIVSGGFFMFDFGAFISSNLVPYDIHIHWDIAGLSVFVALIGISLAAVLYLKPSGVSTKMATALGPVYKATYNKFYFDEIYLFVTHKIIFNLIAQPSAWFDRHVVDGFMNMLAWITNFVSGSIKGLQSGQLQHYAMSFVSGAVALALFFLYFMTR
jgi:NADH-quinone oxidoreductase subunit L